MYYRLKKILIFLFIFITNSYGYKIKTNNYSAIDTSFISKERLRILNLIGYNKQDALPLIEIIVAKNNKHFNDLTSNSIPEWGIAVADRAIDHAVVAADTGQELL